MTEARLENLGSGLAPVTEGWFVVNVSDAEWFSSQTEHACWFANEYGEPPIEFAQLGINVTVLEPGQSGVYHAEANQEAFLVLAGGAGCSSRVRSDGSEWEILHCPPWTEHAFVGGGDRPCVILMVGDTKARTCDIRCGGSRRATARAWRRRRLTGRGICDGGAIPARTAAVLVEPALGFEPLNVALG